jgi:hypothetical protein
MWNIVVSSHILFRCSVVSSLPKGNCVPAAELSLFLLYIRKLSKIIKHLLSRFQKSFVM